jgi:hypothetical protein
MKFAKDSLKTSNLRFGDGGKLNGKDMPDVRATTVAASAFGLQAPPAVPVDQQAAHAPPAVPVDQRAASRARGPAGRRPRHRPNAGAADAQRAAEPVGGPAVRSSGRRRVVPTRFREDAGAAASAPPAPAAAAAAPAPAAAAVAAAAQAQAP